METTEGGTAVPDEPLATRRELDQLRDEMRAMHSDTTAIAVLGTQLGTLAQDFTEFKTDMRSRFAAHDRVHETDQRERTAGRRWLITIAIAGIAAMGGLYGWIALLVH